MTPVSLGTLELLRRNPRRQHERLGGIVKQAMVKRVPSPVDKHVGSRVRMRRMMLGMSREKLGDDLGLTWQQVQKYENGKNPSARALAAHLAYPANPGAVLLRRRTAATGAARGDWTGAVARLCV